MLSQIFVAALLSSRVLAVPAEHGKRQANGPEFTSAADELISEYLNPTAVASVAIPIVSAASAASVQYTNIQSLVYSALEATSIPDWFKSAIPSEYSAQVAALESGIYSLREAATAPVAAASPIVPVVITIGTTNSLGATISTTITTNEVEATGTATVTSATAPTSTGVTISTSTSTTTPASYTTYTNSVGSTITSALGAGVAGASSAGSVAVSGASSVASKVSSGGSSVASKVSSGGNSVVSVLSTAFVGTATSTTTSTSKGGAATQAPVGGMQGAMAVGMAGVLGAFVL